MRNAYYLIPIALGAIVYWGWLKQVVREGEVNIWQAIWIAFWAMTATAGLIGLRGTFEGCP